MFCILVDMVNKSTKAALFSAFVFPGAGHFFLKKYISGTVLAGTAFVMLYFIITNLLKKALQISEKILSGEVQLDIAAIIELVSRQPVGTDAQLLNIATTVLMIFWLIGIIDSYRVGRGQDKDAEANVNGSI